MCASVRDMLVGMSNENPIEPGANEHANFALSVLSAVEQKGLSLVEQLSAPFEVVVLPVVRVASAVQVDPGTDGWDGFLQALSSDFSIVIAEPGWMRPLIAIDFVDSTQPATSADEAKASLCESVRLPYRRYDLSSCAVESIAAELRELLRAEIIKYEEAVWDSGGSLPNDRRRNLLCNDWERRCYQILQTVAARYGMRVILKSRLARTLGRPRVAELLDLDRFGQQGEIDFLLADRFWRPVMLVEFDEEAHLTNLAVINRDTKKKLVCDRYGLFSPHRITAADLKEGADGTTPLETKADLWLKQIIRRLGSDGQTEAA